MDTARPEWQPGQVTVQNNRDFRLYLEGKASNGGFAIDQLTFYPGECPSKSILLVYEILMNSFQTAQKAQEMYQEINEFYLLTVIILFSLLNLYEHAILYDALEFLYIKYTRYKLSLMSEADVETRTRAYFS